MASVAPFSLTCRTRVEGLFDTHVKLPYAPKGFTPQPQAIARTTPPSTRSAAPVVAEAGALQT
jgi:hypothetical protein